MVEHFRPISLSNLSYKMIPKILASPLKNILDHIISPAQQPLFQIGVSIIFSVGKNCSYISFFQTQ